MWKACKGVGGSHRSTPSTAMLVSVSHSLVPAVAAGPSRRLRAARASTTSGVAATTVGHAAAGWAARLSAYVALTSGK